uniref:Uncharacterized protein n=1 Tax=Anguilla anguilla TaxID=7936 RepID=A0A0E9Q6C5_ANGAN
MYFPVSFPYSPKCKNMAGVFFSPTLDLK